MNKEELVISFTHEEWRAIKALLHRAELGKENIKNFYGDFIRMADKIENEMKPK